MELKHLLIIFIIILTALLMGIGIGLLIKPDPKPLTEQQIKDQNQLERREYYYDIPDLLSQIQSNNQKSVFVKVRYIIAVDDEKILDIIQQRLPKIVDRNTVFIRELDVDTLQGAEGIYRLKENLLSQAILILRPYRPADILIKEFLVQ
jgi:flagellar FliL protein